MKATKILAQVLELNEVEQQGIAVSGLFETLPEFGSRWFGEDSEIIVGGFKNDIQYFYSYCTPLKGIADIILAVDGCKVFLYEMED